MHSVAPSGAVGRPLLSTGCSARASPSSLPLGPPQGSLSVLEKLSWFLAEVDPVSPREAMVSYLVSKLVEHRSCLILQGTLVKRQRLCEAVTLRRWRMVGYLTETEDSPQERAM